MKPKLILCLALVLSSGLFGCSTANQHYEQMQNSDKQIMVNRIKVGMTHEQVEAIIFSYHPSISGQNDQLIHDPEVSTTTGAGRSTYYPLDESSGVVVRWNQQDKVKTVEFIKK